MIDVRQHAVCDLARLPDRTGIGDEQDSSSAEHREGVRRNLELSHDLPETAWPTPPDNFDGLAGTMIVILPILRMSRSHSRAAARTSSWGIAPSFHDKSAYTFLPCPRSDGIPASKCGSARSQQIGPADRAGISGQSFAAPGTVKACTDTRRIKTPT